MSHMDTHRYMMIISTCEKRAGGKVAVDKKRLSEKKEEKDGKLIGVPVLKRKDSSIHRREHRADMDTDMLVLTYTKFQPSVLQIYMCLTANASSTFI